MPSLMLLCGRIFLVARFLRVFFPRILAHTDGALEVRIFAKLPAVDPVFPQIFMWCHVPLENLTVWFDPIFPLSVE